MKKREEIVRITARYAAFAAIATLINLGSQKATDIISSQIFNLDTILNTIVLFFMSTDTFILLASIAVGTGTGLLTKYILDKKFIFNYQTKDVKHDAKLFVLYTVMGLATTAIFWGFEVSFYYLFGTEVMKYFGAIIGLMIGYVTKYFLDKKFVFVDW